MAIESMATGQEQETQENTDPKCTWKEESCHNW